MVFAFTGINLFTQEIKRAESWTGGLGKVWGESLQECKLHHLKLRSQADGDPVSAYAGGTFPVLLASQLALSLYQEMGVFPGREQCTCAWGDSQRWRLTTLAFKKLSGGEKESTLPTHLVDTSTEPTQGGEERIFHLWILGKDSKCFLWILGKDSAI